MLITTISGSISGFGRLKPLLLDGIKNDSALCENIEKN